MQSVEASSPWRRFWNRGGWWKALLLVVVYYGLYQLGGVLLEVVFGLDKVEPGSALGTFLSVGLPIVLGSILLVVFGWSVGWLRELFGRQRIGGRGWMWIAVVVVLVTNILRFVALDYSTAGIELVLAWLLTGLFVGFAEELLTRGFVVQLMRKAGHPEIAVALVSAALFAVLHIGNVFDGQGVLTTALQVAYTFFFGILMYLAYRVTGRLIVPILLHASTDPSIFLLAQHPGTGPLTPFAGFGNIIVIVVGLVLLIVLIVHGGRDRAVDRAAARPIV